MNFVAVKLGKKKTIENCTKERLLVPLEGSINEINIETNSYAKQNKESFQKKRIGIKRLLFL